MATATVFTNHVGFVGHGSAPTTSSHGIEHRPDGLEVFWLVRPSTPATDVFVATTYHWATPADSGSGAWIPAAQNTLNAANGFVLAQACTGDRVSVYITATSGTVADVSYTVRKLGR